MLVSTASLELDAKFVRIMLDKLTFGPNFHEIAVTTLNEDEALHTSRVR